MASNKRIIMKKIFFNGKVYDHNKKHSLFDIQQEIQTELDNKYGAGKLCMQISIPNKNEYQFLLYRSFAKNIKPGMTAFDDQTIYMFDYDLFLGNDPSSQFRPYAFMVHYYEQIDEFVKQYKKKAVKAGGNRPKEITIEDNTNYIKVTVKY